MTQIDQIRRRIHDHIVENFLFGTGDVDDGASLLEEGVLDSMGVLEIVLFFEEQLGIAVSDDEVLPERFDSVDALTAFAATKLHLGDVEVARDEQVMA